MAKNTKTVASKPAVTPASVEQDETQEAVLAWKELFKDTNNRDMQLSDKVVAEIISRKQFIDLDDDAKLALFLQAETTAQKVMVTDAGITALVKKQDDEFLTEVAACIEAKIKDKTSAVDIYAQFKRVYTKEEMDSMALPGSEAEHVMGTNFRVDKVKTKDQSGNPVTKVWTNDFVSAMKQGKEYEDAIALIQKEKDNAGTTSLKGKGKLELAAMLSSATQKRNALRSIVKRAIKLHHRFEAVRGLPLVDIAWIPGTKSDGISVPGDFGSGEMDESATIITKAPKPIWINPTKNIAGGRDFSVTQLLAMQPDLAKLGEGGGTMADLVATAGKGSDDNEGDGTGDGTDMDDSEAQATASMFANFLKKVENKASIRKMIADYKKNPNGMDWLDLVMELDKQLHPIAEMNRNTYLNIQNAKLLNEDNKAEKVA